jgi:hypothetical protein
MLRILLFFSGSCLKTEVFKQLYYLDLYSVPLTQKGDIYEKNSAAYPYALSLHSIVF